MTHTILQSLSHFFSAYGYWVVFFGVMLENAGIPVPGETVLLFAGYLAYHGKMDLVPAMLVAIAGATIGDSIGFLIGHYGGRSLVEEALKRFPRLARSFGRSQSLFLKYGQWAVFTGRFIAGLRVFAGIIAGLFRMPYSRFLFFNFTGAATWALTVTYVGFIFGSSWELVQRRLRQVNEIALAAVGLVILIGVVGYYIHQRKGSSSRV